MVQFHKESIEIEHESTVCEKNEGTGDCGVSFVGRFFVEVITLQNGKGRREREERMRRKGEENRKER